MYSRSSCRSCTSRSSSIVSARNQDPALCGDEAAPRSGIARLRGSERVRCTPAAAAALADLGLAVLYPPEIRTLPFAEMKPRLAQASLGFAVVKESDVLPQQLPLLQI